MRREAHELSSMLDEIETHARNAIDPDPLKLSKAKRPPAHCIPTDDDEADASVAEPEPEPEPYLERVAISARPPVGWSVEELAAWLTHDLGLGSVAMVCTEQAVDGALALEMDCVMWRDSLGAEGLDSAKIRLGLKQLSER